MCIRDRYESGMDDHGIMRRTGHRSTDGLKPYKRMGEMYHVNSSAQIDRLYCITKLFHEQRKEGVQIRFFQCFQLQQWLQCDYSHITATVEVENIGRTVA